MTKPPTDLRTAPSLGTLHPSKKTKAFGTELTQERRVFCNRTLNLRSIRAIGYDMDYTLIHYNVEAWEKRAYEYLKQKLMDEGWPVDKLHFDPKRVCRGLVIDADRGNLLKANRFGFVKRAMHGTRVLDYEKQRQTYSRMVIDLAESNFVFLNTLFSLSEGCMYAQTVDLLDKGLIPEVLGYRDLYERVRKILDAAHMEGRLKAEIIAHPEQFVVRDPEVALTLLDQCNAGKKLLLITNSEWSYTSSMMSHTFDEFLPKGMTWRDLFEIVIVGARKPQFFTTQSPFFEVVTEEGLLQPSSGPLKQKTAYLGGSARDVEKHLGLSGDEILYVGDHMFGDVHFTKNVLRWRTALILRELEEEILANKNFHADEIRLAVLMERKQEIEAEICEIKVLLQRERAHYGPPVVAEDMPGKLSTLSRELEQLDNEISPLAKLASELNNNLWGLLMRAGNDKSHLAYQVERYADIYTSRVSNLLFATPFMYFRSPRGSLPHDPALEGKLPVTAGEGD